MRKYKLRNFIFDVMTVVAGALLTALTGGWWLLWIGIREWRYAHEK